MRIGLITQWFPAGAGYVSRAYARALEPHHRVFIYARGGRCMRHDAQWDSANVTWAPSHTAITGVHRSHFTRWARRNSLDAVLFNEQRHWRGALLAKQMGLLCGAYVDYYTQDTVPLFGVYDFLICNTKRHYSVFAKHPQCRYVPWGTRTDVYKPAHERARRPLTFLINAGWDGRFASAVPWLDRRGAGLTMQVFSRLEGQCRLLVLSQCPLDECPPDWRRAVAGDPRIDFRLGTFEPVPYLDGDVYVYPSRLDGIGLTLPEALSSGLPAIATNCAPMNEFVRDGENGFLVTVRESLGRPDGYYWPESICDEAALGLALRRYRDAPELVEAHARNARSIAERDLSWEKNTSGLGEWFETLQTLPINFEGLSRGIDRYDRVHNPTAVQRVIAGLKALGRAAVARSRRQ